MKRLYGACLVLLLAACGQSLSVEQKMCRFAIEDVFLPVNKLDINSVGLNDNGTEIQVPVEYSITDATGKRVDDTAICAFDKTVEPALIKSIIQFNNQIPAPYVEFINKRVARKLAGATANGLAAEETNPPPSIPLKDPPESTAPAAAEPPATPPAGQ